MPKDPWFAWYHVMCNTYGTWLRGDRPRQRLGWAKYYATKAVKQFLNAHGAAAGSKLELKEGEGIWGKRSECVPIEDREHRTNSFELHQGPLEEGRSDLVEPAAPQVRANDLNQPRIRKKTKDPRQRRGVSRFGSTRFQETMIAHHRYNDVLHSL